MTPDEFRSRCQTPQTPLAFAQAVGGLSEAERKKLSKTAQELYREAREAERQNWNRPSHEGGVARLALLACGPWSQAKRVNSGDSFPDTVRWMRAAVQILTDRRPAWAGDWVGLLLDTERDWELTLSWNDVRRLMQAGVIEKPTVDGYIRLLARSGFREFEPGRDADVLEEDVWRLFSVDTLAFEFLPEPKKVDREKWQRGEQATKPGYLHEVYDGWPRRLFELAHRGEISRDRLLDETLAALWRDFRGPMRTGLMRYLEILAPTDDEIAARQAEYQELLRNDLGTAVSAAVKALGRLQQTGRLDVAAFLEAVPAVFVIEAKTQPKSALSLVDRVVKKSPEHLSAAVASVAAALNHNSPDVQERALDLLAKWKAADPSLDLAGAIESATLLAPQHQARLEEIAGAPTSPVAASQADAATGRGNLEDQREALRVRLAALPAQVREAAGLAGLEEALDAGGLPPPFDPEPGRCPVLSGVAAVVPIGDVDELIDFVAHLFEVIEGPEQLERILDGLIRLSGETTDDFDAKRQGLRRPRFGSEWIGQTTPGLLMWSCPSLMQLIARWLGVRFQDPWETGREESPALNVFDQRCVMLLAPWAEQHAGPVLATPTHHGGWIDPQVFVARLNALHVSGRAADRFDLIGGLLRLAPDGRNEALDAAVHIPAPFGPIVRYALGGDERPTKNDRNQAAEWLAAGRCRAPRAYLAELEVLGLSDREPDGIAPAEFRFDPRVDLRDLKFSLGSRCVQVAPDAVTGNLTDRPTVALAVQLLQPGMTDFYADWQNELAASLWPANPDATLARACHKMMQRLDDKGSAFEPIGGLLAPLQQRDQGWSEIARVALWLALLSRDDHARGLGIDALIEGISDGRADPAAMSETLIHIASGGWIKLNRLAESLREVTRTSVLAERVAADILDRLIASWSALPRDGHHVLALQLDLLTSLRRAPAPQALEVLSGVKGGGKAAKLAQRLSSLETDPASPAMQQAALEAAVGRLARAERILSRGRSEE